MSPTRKSTCILALAGVAVAALSACKGLTSVDASLDNVTDTSQFYTINGSPPGSPTAINLFSGAIFRADPSFGYDIAFDLDTSGKAILIPARALATVFSAPYSVGLVAVAGNFDDITSAPKDGYVLDSTLVVGVGTTVVIQSFDLATCQFAIKGQSYFSKLVVTSIDIPSRRISAKYTVNRNCGFTSFAAGIPKS